MTLTKDQRYILYCFMLAEIERLCYDDMPYWGICSLAYNNFDQSEELAHDNDLNAEVDFPELYSKSTGGYDVFGNRTEGGSYWFKDWKERIAALKQCIYETHPDNPINKRKR